MTPAPPSPDPTSPEDDQSGDVLRKPRSSKQFFMATSARLAFGLGAIGLIGTIVWLARHELATAGLSSFLASKGIPAEVTIENLQLDTAQIGNIRLGSPDNPSLIVRKAILKWRVDSKARLFIVERLQADGVVLRLGVDKDGKVDLGALAPFLEPTSGPKRSVMRRIDISNARVLVDTPFGQSSARLTVTGGEAMGWVGTADLVPPAPFIVKSDDARFVPIRLGFALKPATPDNQTTQIGFSARPSGQSLAFEEYRVFGLAGDITGQILLQKGGAVRIDTRAARIKATRLSAPGLQVAGLDVATNPVFWSHTSPWQTNGWGNIVASGKLDSVSMVDPKLALGATRFRIGAARAQSGRMQLDYQSDLQNLSGPVSGRRLVAAGNVTTTLKDMTQIGGANFAGKGQFTASSFVLPLQIRNTLPATIPRPVFDALAGTFSGSGTLDYAINAKQSRISLVGPLTVSGSTGARASLVPTSRAAPTLLISNKPGGKTQITALATGKLAMSLPEFGALAGHIDGASFGPNGWAVIGRDATLQSIALSPALDASLRLDQFDISANRIGTLNGRGSGQITHNSRGTAPSPTRAVLDFDASATPTTISGTLAGPIEGFGSLSGLGGYGVRGGVLRLSGTGTATGPNWQFDARGELKASALATNVANIVAPTLALSGAGQIGRLGTLSATTRFSARGASAQSMSRGAPATLGAVQLDGRADLNGKLDALQVAGNLNTAVTAGAFNGFRIERATNETEFTGLVNPDQFRLTGAHKTAFNRIVSSNGQPNGRIDVSDARASGPFRVQMGGQGQGSPFWSGRLGARGTSITSALALDAGKLLAGSTSLTNVRLTAPVAFASNGASWQANADLNLVTQALTTGDTRLNGVVASGPIAVASTGPQNIAVTSTRCLDFSARSGTFPGQASVGAVSGKLCPDANGQLAILGDGSPRLFAKTNLDPLALEIGSATGGQRIDIGDVSGTITTKANGSLDLQMQATQFALSFKLPDGAIAQIKANEAALEIVPGADGIGLTGRIGRVSSIGLPVLMSGGATASLTAGPRGLAGTFSFDDIIIKDIEKSPRFGELTLIGSGALTGNQVSITADILEPASEIKMAGVTFSHDIGSDSGNLDLSATDLLLSPVPVRGRPGLDIVTIIPPLRGVVSDMVGVANASANFAWSRSAPLVSRANIETIGLDFATMLGPVTGLSGKIALDDVLLVRTAGRQTIKVGLFDPGLPIAGGIVQFTLPGNNSLRLEDASWPFAEGKLSVRPATWAFRDGEQRFSIDVEDVDLAKLLRLTEVPNLEIDGKVSGVFPIQVVDGNVEIVGGRLKAREGGGVIRYTGPNASPPPPPPGFVARMRQRLFGKPAPAGADLAIEALRALEYKILEITVDGRITGELQMGVILEGANQQVLSGQPFKFNVKMNVPIGQLIDNLNRLNNSGSSPEVLAEIDRVMREDAAKLAPPPAPSPLPAPTPLPVPAPLREQPAAPTPAP